MIRPTRLLHHLVRNHRVSLRSPGLRLAFLLSLLMPGAGHVYAGYLGRGVAMFVVASLSVQMAVAVLMANPLTVPRVSLVLAIVLVLAAAAVNATRMAKRGRIRFATRRLNAMAVMSFLLVGWVLESGASQLRHRWFGKPYWLPTESMIPTLVVGDHFTTRPLRYDHRDPVLGDIVVFKPVGLQQTFVKRIVGLPGDTVSFDGAALSINGTRVTGRGAVGEITTALGNLDLFEERLGDRAYQVADDPCRDARPSGPFTVQANHYFVAGDNRDYSNDSRVWGSVHRDEIVAPTGSIFWSWAYAAALTSIHDPVMFVRVARERIQWGRIGIETN